MVWVYRLFVKYQDDIETVCIDTGKDDTPVGHGIVSLGYGIDGKWVRAPDQEGCVQKTSDAFLGVKWEEPTAKGLQGSYIVRRDRYGRIYALLPGFGDQGYVPVCNPHQIVDNVSIAIKMHVIFLANLNPHFACNINYRKHGYILFGQRIWWPKMAGVPVYLCRINEKEFLFFKNKFSPIYEYSLKCICFDFKKRITIFESVQSPLFATNDSVDDQIEKIKIGIPVIRQDQLEVLAPENVHPDLRSSFIPKPSEKSVFRLERKLSRIDDRRLRKLVRINAIRTNLRSSIIGALAKPKSRFFRWFGYNKLPLSIEQYIINLKANPMNPDIYHFSIDVLDDRIFIYNKYWESRWYSELGSNTYESLIARLPQDNQLIELDLNGQSPNWRILNGRGSQYPVTISGRKEKDGITAIVYRSFTQFPSDLFYDQTIGYICKQNERERWVLAPMSYGCVFENIARSVYKDSSRSISPENFSTNEILASQDINNRAFLLVPANGGYVPVRADNDDLCVDWQYENSDHFTLIDSNFALHPACNINYVEHGFELINDELIWWPLKNGFMIMHYQVTRDTREFIFFNGALHRLTISFVNGRQEKRCIDVSRIDPVLSIARKKFSEKTQEKRKFFELCTDISLEPLRQILEGRELVVDRALASSRQVRSNSR